MALIGCGDLSCLLLLPLIHSLLNFSNFEIYKKTEYANHPIVICLLSNLILCLLFVPYLFSKFCCNSKKDYEDNKEKPTFIIKIKHLTLFIFVLGFLFEMANIFHSVFSYKIASKKDFFMNDYLFELFFIIIASKIFCKSLIYKHQQVSIVFIFLLGIGFYAIDILYYPYSYELIFLILKQIIFGISVVLIKYLTQLKGYSIFKVLFLFGVAGLIFDLFILIITTNVKCGGELNGICSSVVHNYRYENNISNYTYNPNNTFIDINDYDNISKVTNISNIVDVELDNSTANYTLFITYKNTFDNPYYYLDNLKDFIDDYKNNGATGKDIINIIYLAFSSISIFLLFIIIQKLSPSYTYLSSVLLTIFSKTKELFYKGTKEVFILLIQIAIVIVILFWTLIYNELLELNCCKLNEDTQANKLKRNDIDERRKSDWVTSKGYSDADATLVDETLNNQY